MADPDSTLMEDWRPVTLAGYGSYSISNCGRLRSPRGHIVTPRMNRNGYPEVALLVKGGKKITRRVHRLLALAFIPNPLNKPEVNHVDSNRANNALENLEWCTHQENMQHSSRMGRATSGSKGKRMAQSKLTYAEAQEIRALYGNGGVSQRRLAASLGISRDIVYRVLSGRFYRSEAIS